MDWQQIDLPHLAGVAGATVGLVIATGILLSWFTATFAPNFDRYRDLCAQYRVGCNGNVAKENGSADFIGDRNVHDQIVLIRRRLRFICRGACTLCLALFCSLSGMAFATLAILFRGNSVFVAIGVVSVFGAFLMFGIAVMLILIESRLDVIALARETKGLPLALRTTNRLTDRLTKSAHSANGVLMPTQSNHEVDSSRGS